MNDRRWARLLRLILSLVVVTAGLLVVRSGVWAEPPAPDERSPVMDADIPPLENGAPYTSPLIATPRERASVSESLTIDVWYGLEQTFGEPGLTQPWLTILGRVTGPLPVQSLGYTLNGGPAKPLSIGPDSRRLFGEGDFIIEIDYRTVLPLPQVNTVVISADDGQTQTSQTVIVRFVPGAEWPLPYLADWSEVSDVTAAAQPLTGLWAINNGLLENVDVGYDRLLAIGDQSWTDYEITVPVTVHSLNTCCWSGPSVGGGVGLIVRWPGHFQREPSEQPALGWRNLGALAWHRWSPQGDAVLELLGQGGQPLVSRTDRPVILGVPYIYKLRVESSAVAGQPALYSLKVWEAAQPEPAQWTLQSQGRKGEPASGSIVLVAHQAEVTFGDVLIVPLDFEGLTVTIQPPENGTIELDPAMTAYRPGDQVTIEAVPSLGYKFTGWLDDLSGDENPITITLTESITVGATFAPETYRVYISPVASGTVGGVAFRRGDILGVDSLNRWSPLLQADAVPLGNRGDIEAFTFLADGSLAVVIDRRQTVPGLGVVMPHDILHLMPDANGSFSGGSIVSLLDGSDVGLTTAGERIDALATTPDGRLVISTTGRARVLDQNGTEFVADDEDLIVFAPQSLGETTTGSWAMLCDGSAIAGLAGEDVVGASLAADGTTWYLSLQNRFRIGGIVGGNRDVVRLSDCSASMTAERVWNSRDAGLSRPFDAMAFLP